jgi:hypothetical protein
MNKFQFASWVSKDNKHGFGQVISDEQEGHVLVAVHGRDSSNNPPIPQPGAELDVCPVVYMPVTRLTLVNVPPKPATPVTAPHAAPAAHPAHTAQPVHNPVIQPPQAPKHH